MNIVQTALTLEPSAKGAVEMLVTNLRGPSKLTREQLFLATVVGLMVPPPDPADHLIYMAVMGAKAMQMLAESTPSDHLTE